MYTVPLYEDLVSVAMKSSAAEYFYQTQRRLHPNLRRSLHQLLFPPTANQARESGEKAANQARESGEKANNHTTKMQEQESGEKAANQNEGGAERTTNQNGGTTSQNGGLWGKHHGAASSQATLSSPKAELTNPTATIHHNGTLPRSPPQTANHSTAPAPRPSSPFPHWSQKQSVSLTES